MSDIQEIRVWRGATKIIEIQCLQADGVTPFNLTGCRLYMAVKDNLSATTYEIIKDSNNVGDFDFYDAVNGLARTKLDWETTLALTAKDHVIDGWLIDTLGDPYVVMRPARFVVGQPVGQPLT